MLPFFEANLLGFELKISSYNLMIGIGIMVGLLVLQNTCNKLRIAKPQVDNLMVMLAVSLPVGFGSAILFNNAYHYNNAHGFLSNLTTFSGMTFEGGLVGGAITFILMFRSLNKQFKGMVPVLNCIAPSIIISHFWGRIGCFLAGCCFGKPTNSVLGVVFPDRSLPSQFYGEAVKIIPVQLIEALFLAVLFIIISTSLLKYSFSCYLIIYGIFRFFIEYLRGDDRGALFQTVLSPSQCISLLMMLIGVIILLNEYKGVLLVKTSD